MKAILAAFALSSAVSAAPAPPDTSAASKPAAAAVATVTAEAAPEAPARRVRFGGEAAFAGPYVWRGLRLTQGNCFQPRAWAAWGDLTASVFLNLYGSKKDLLYQESRNADKTLTPETGPGSKGFGEVSEVKFHLDWRKSFGEMLRLRLGYTHLAYSPYPADFRNKDEFEDYAWFDEKSSYGEINARPSLQVGKFNLFTERNLVVFAGTWEKTGEKWDDARGIFYQDTTRISERWNHQYSYGISFATQAAEHFSVEVTLQENFASAGFLAKWIRDLDTGEGVDTQGFYSTGLRFTTHYDPTPWFSLSPTVGAEILTNDKVSNNSNIRGALMYGSLATAFAW